MGGKEAGRHTDRMSIWKNDHVSAASSTPRLRRQRHRQRLLDQSAHGKTGCLLAPATRRCPSVEPFVNDDDPNDQPKAGRVLVLQGGRRPLLEDRSRL